MKEPHFVQAGLGTGDAVAHHVVPEPRSLLKLPTKP
jgi:hypothetical protein